MRLDKKIFVSVNISFNLHLFAEKNLMGQKDQNNNWGWSLKICSVAVSITKHFFQTFGITLSIITFLKH